MKHPMLLKNYSSTEARELEGATKNERIIYWRSKYLKQFNHSKKMEREHIAKRKKLQAELRECRNSLIDVLNVPYLTKWLGK